MADNTFRLRLVTPTEALLDEPVTYVNLPAWDGLMGVMHNRAPLVARLGLGEMTVSFPPGTHGGGDRRYFLNGGFAQMAGNELIVLAEHAEAAEAIAVSDAEAQVADADRLTAETGEPAYDAAERIREAKERARTRLRVARHAASAGRGI